VTRSDCVWRQRSLMTCALLIAFASVPFASIVSAQTSSGTISGRVFDSSDQSVPGALVTLTSTDTRGVRTFTTDQDGRFVFNSIEPGTYDLAVDLPGFKRYEKKGLSLSASERLQAGDLRLETGAITEVVQVNAEVAKVQDVSSERSALLDSTQVTNLLSRGRDVMALLTILPGVVNDGEGSDSLGVFNSPAAVSGARSNFSGMNIDGVSGNTRDGSRLDTPVNMDAVAEVKVLMNTYQAEYGKGAGAIINVVTKGGSSKYSGALYDYIRNEGFNANSFMNNRQGIAQNRYRYNTFGYNFGGPLFVPGGFNAHKDKLFFFFSQEILRNEQPNGPRNYTVPTAAERMGDFSHSIDVSSLQPIYVKDPLKSGTCSATSQAACFSGNIVPADRINPEIQKLLNIFPLPNVTPDATHHYNYQIADTLKRPVTQEVLRVDYNISDKVRAYARGMYMTTHNTGLASTTNKFTWGIGAMDYGTTGPNVGGTVTWIISPTMINETTVGWAAWTELQTIAPDVLSKLQKQNLGINLGQINPAMNPLNVIPTMTFGGITSAATTSYDARFPLKDDTADWSFSDSLSKVWRSHQFKVGIQAEHVIYNQYHTGTANFAGNFKFDRDTNNPNDSGYAYANALLGNFSQYTEGTARADYSPVTRILEWYGQDSWRASSRLTLDLGVRFTAGLPQVPSSHGVASAFVPSLYDPAKAPALYQPGKDDKGTRVAIDPTCPGCPPKPAVYIGLLVPGSGDLTNGLAGTFTPGYPRGLIDYQGISAAPRLGFAYDLTGDHKTALRGGFGVNYNPRAGSGILGDATGNPPTIYNPTQYYGNAATFQQVGTFQGPSGINQSLERKNPVPRVYNTSLGVQRELWWNTVVDIAYVGGFGRDMGLQYDINEVPYGSRLLPQNQDPTTGRVLSDNFFRPYPGYGGIPMVVFSGTSSYHSMQTQVTHRFSDHVQFGVAWTWSKALDLSEGDQNSIAVYQSPDVWNWGFAGYDRTHAVAINYVLDLPGVRRFTENALMHGIFDGWQLAGTTRFVSGAPLYWKTGTSAGNSNNSFGTGDLSDGADLVGGGDGWRPVVVGNSTLPASQRTFEEWFNTAAFARPAPGDRGNAGSVVARGPGINNFNMSLFKNFRVAGRGNLQFRAEAYNVFNHTQFNLVNTTLKFDATGKQVNADFGQVTTVRDPRIMQFALRLTF
jgi:hypothetical protein